MAWFNEGAKVWDSGDEPTVICKCAMCEEEILEGEDVYETEDGLIHDDCLRDWAAKMRTVAKRAR